jgi:hypothetical protein
MSLYQELHELAIQYPEGDPKPIAQTYLASKSKDDLLDLVADALVTARRNHVRGVEALAFTRSLSERVSYAADDELDTELRPVTLVGAMAKIPREQFLQLLDKQFALDQRGTMVHWGEATVAQHQARIGMLERHVAGTLTTITRHRQAITLIEQEGAHCLNEVLQTTAAA